MTTINSKITTDDREAIDLRQCDHNSKIFSEALEGFKTDVSDRLSVAGFVRLEIGSWLYFTENKLGNVDEYQLKWKVN